MRLADSNKTLSAHVAALIEQKGDISRIELSKRMGVADGTLGRIKYGRANPTLDVVDRIAAFFKVEPWELLKPKSSERKELIDQLSALATPRSRAALDAISRAAEQGRLSEDDLLLLQRIAQRFMTE